ncbi:helix-turn-helix transcriptional regulator [Myxococcus sp. AM009]|uniref:helix-turn-helix transcriptional regulator n=2 Tax=unclassified Myxococcus TaxID=2648731 RepID=UPI001595C578|nr:helix-turn-helix transcriptional regulator [Myxococcus sp. AM010]NVI97468.1 helix-turn-helix transcriptional regulator [Myxococcus sp. AM009]NVJ15098.1 helix-turn-helix transcriptional regulator [Myxococcus sp. AM010]
MFNPMDFNAHELMARNRVTEALCGSLSLPEVLSATRAPLLEFVQADSMALCLMRVAPSLDFRWHVPGPPIPILEEYAGVVDHDFLRDPILARPGVPICDTQLLSRAEYERTLIYQRSLELEPRLEHIMAVLVPIRPGLVGALAFYRHERYPFPSQSITALSGLTRHLASTLGNCHAYQDLTAGAQLLQELYHRKDCAFLVLKPPTREVSRSLHATALLERWFTPSDLHASGLPRVLQEQLDALVRMDADSRIGKNLWVINHPEGYRTCRFVELPASDGPRQWALLLSELPHSIPLPLDMQRALTPRELDIARGVLRNWSNGQIADELNISGQTVKAHVRNLFDKLGVDGRVDFLYQAAHLNRPV